MEPEIDVPQPDGRTKFDLMAYLELCGGKISKMNYFENSRKKSINFHFSCFKVKTCYVVQSLRLVSYQNFKLDFDNSAIFRSTKEEKKKKNVKSNLI